MDGNTAQQGKTEFEVHGMFGDTTEQKACRRGTVSLRTRVSVSQKLFGGYDNRFTLNKLQNLSLLAELL